MIFNPQELIGRTEAEGREFVTLHEPTLSFKVAKKDGEKVIHPSPHTRMTVYVVLEDDFITEFWLT